MKKLSVVIFAALVFAFIGSRLLTKSNAQISEIKPGIQTQKQKVADKLIESARQTGRAHVIIAVPLNFIVEGRLTESQLERQREAIKESQNEFLSRYQTSSIANVKQFEYIPFMAFETDAETLERIKFDAAVVSIEEDVIGEPALAQSTTIVGANTAWASGYTGSGQTIAVLDSGVDRNHPFLSGRIVSEGCYSSTNASSTSYCPGGASESTALNSGVNCPVNVNGCAHGTNVAGIAAGSGATFSGVAKGANVIAIQMFSQFTCSGSPCARYWTSDLIRGLERVRTLSATMNNIAAVNLSLQTGENFPSNCNTNHSATKAVIDNLRSVGIPTVICSGNYSFTNALTAPACISTSISVGSTDDGSSGVALDVVSSFSDSSPLLHLLAPGRWINSSIPNNTYQEYSGTSMAAPHVAGAFAILKQRKPNANVQQILNTLISTGLPITDARNGIVKPRIRINDAVNAIAQPRASFDFDGDGRADVSVFRPSLGAWFINNSSNSSFTATQFGVLGDLLAPADFDGDGKTDVAVFRPSTGSFYRLNSSNNSFTAVQFGSLGDVPVTADFDGDGKAEIAVYRASGGAWYRLNSADGQFAANQFGTAEDKPALGDFDGDGKADISVFRPSNGIWYRLNSSNNQLISTQFGANDDKPVPADFDGDGKTDVAVFRSSNGSWYVLNSSTGAFSGTQFGIAEDKPAPADFDGDGKADPAVFRPSTGSWYLLRSTQGFTGLQFGISEDLPTPNAFVR